MKNKITSGVLALIILSILSIQVTFAQSSSNEVVGPRYVFREMIRGVKKDPNKEYGTVVEEAEEGDPWLVFARNNKLSTNFYNLNWYNEGVTELPRDIYPNL